MKIELGAATPEGLKENYPGQFEVGRWLDNIIPFPMQIFIVTTRKKNGLNNAQLNSWGMTAGPGSKPRFLFQDMEYTDTYKLINVTGEFVINLFPKEIRDNAFKTALHYEENIDEVLESGLTPIEGLKTNACRIKECVAHYECKLEWTKPLGNGHVLVCGEIVSASVDEGLLTGDLKEILETADIMFYLKSPIDCKDGWKVSDKYFYGAMSDEIFE
ncbi:MAG: flavin reductase [Bacillota bacterium]|nr:flavin reductase [Bacillota bacterium]